MTPQSARNLSVDVFRGLTLALMIVVNTPGSWSHIYGPLQHAPWHGWTITDLVFPSFLFVVGAAMRLAMKKFDGVGERRFLATVVKRGALIFLCGYLLYWFPFVSEDFTLMPIGGTRIMGVLQRIGLCYLAAAIVVRYCGIRGVLAWSAAALLAWWWILAAFGDYTLHGNVARKVDLAVLGASHMYQGEGIAFDPEGILSTLPAIVNVLGGYLAMVWIEARGRSTRTVLGLVGFGLACVLLAYAWHPALPINKKLWTSSYVLLSIGADLLVLAVLVQLVDRAGWRAGVNFPVVFGKNTLFIYLLSSAAVTVLVRLYVDGVTLYDWLYQGLVRLLHDPVMASLAFALAYMLACWLVAWAMDRRRIYIKL